METPPITMRQLMPAGYLRTLAKRLGLKTVSYLQTVVDMENTGWKHWAEVAKLAQETNPEGFAQWEAAQVQAA